MSAALRYARRRPEHEIALAVPRGGASRVHLPDPQSKASFMAAVLEARCTEGEELELLGEPVARLSPAARARLLRRVGVVSPGLALIGSLNAWENIALPAAYHGTPPRERVAHLAQNLLEAFGVEPGRFLARLPDELERHERLLVGFVRALAAEPELAIFDALEDGLSREERACVARFEGEYRARHPSGTVLHVDSREESS